MAVEGDPENDSPGDVSGGGPEAIVDGLCPMCRQGILIQASGFQTAVRVLLAVLLPRHRHPIRITKAPLLTQGDLTHDKSQTRTIYPLERDD